jgi:hypothetical protein
LSVVELGRPYGAAEIMALGMRVVLKALGAMVAHRMPRKHKRSWQTGRLSKGRT